MAWNDYSDTAKFGIGAGLGGIGAGLGGFLFGGGQNPGNIADRYLKQIPGQIQGYYDPYSQAGQRMIPGLEGQYGNLMNDPGGMLNKIGQGYHQSPGFQFALQQALGAGNRSMAAGGMAGSPMHEQQNMQMATQMANQDYNNWLQQATGMFGRGLSGAEGLMHTGYGAGNDFASQIAQALASRAGLGYAGAANQNQQQGSMIGDFMGGLGMLGAFL